MVRTFLEVTAEANATWAAGKSDIKIIAKDDGMNVEKTKNQMAGFQFPTPAEQRKSWMNKGGKVENMLKFMCKMFGTAENPALKNYYQTMNASFLP